MVSGEVETTAHASASSTLHARSTNFVTGEGSVGDGAAWTILDMLVGGTAGCNHRDGADFAGDPAFAHHLSDVEKFERTSQSIPHSA